MSKRKSPAPPRRRATPRRAPAPPPKVPTLAAALRDLGHGSWNQVKALIASGKVTVNGTRILAIDHRLEGNEEIAIAANAPRPQSEVLSNLRILHDDSAVVVIEKPEGISTVPYQDERDTAMDLLRAVWRRQGRPGSSIPLHVVHRIDKATSGLVVFAKNKGAEIRLGRQFRDHSIDRIYLCVAHGHVRSQRIESRLVSDRGDGLRGSARRGDPSGKRAVTHVCALADLQGATLVAIRLETGKTHQIRIHLAEAGHPLVGETVYIRDLRERGERTEIASPRLLLHAATLGFEHPVTGERIQFQSVPPAAFVAEVARLATAATPAAPKTTADWQASLNRAARELLVRDYPGELASGGREGAPD